MPSSPLRALQVLGTTLALSACTETGILPSSGSSGGSAGRAAAGQGGTAGKPSSGGASSGAAGTGTTAGSGNGASGGAGGTPSQGGGRGGTAAGASAGRGGGSGRGGSGGASSAGRGGSGGTATGEGGEGGDTTPQGGQDGGGSEEIPAGYVKAIIGVGYGGIRIVSRDDGKTWGDRVYDGPNGGDDDDLLRAITYGKGRWVASGWKLVTSDDGVHWDERGRFRDDDIIGDEAIIEGLAYKDGYFYAGGDGDPSRIYRSADGVEWERFGEIGDTVKHTGLTFRGGVFVSYGDSNTSYRSTDGLAWTDMQIDQATYCENEWKSFEDCHEAWWSDDGYYIFPEWGGQIRLSTTGSNFQTVYTDDQENTFYRSRAVAQGYVAP